MSEKESFISHSDSGVGHREVTSIPRCKSADLALLIRIEGDLFTRMTSSVGEIGELKAISTPSNLIISSIIRCWLRLANSIDMPIPFDPRDNKLAPARVAKKA